MRKVKKAGSRNHPNTSLTRALVVLVVILIIVSVANIYVSQKSQYPIKSMDDGPAASVEDISEIASSTASPGSFFNPGSEFIEQNVLRVEGNVIVIGTGCTAIVATTSPERAEAIDEGIRGVVSDRPNAYDSWAAMMERFGMEFEAMAMHGLTEEAYLSRTYFKFGEYVLDLDMRPSDAIALAVRTKTPIYLNSTLLDVQGQNIC